METLEVDQREISKIIRNDLEMVQELSTVSEDPIGYTAYLYFLLKNKIRSVEIDNLVDWMNSWVENILIRRNFSRFIDRELTSSLFAYFSLRMSGQSRVDVKVENLKQLFTEHIDEKHFFSNFTLSSLIASALADFKDQIEEYSNLITWIEGQVNEKIIFNDAKNLVFASILFEKLGSDDNMKRIFDYCYEKLLQNTIVSYDQLYYAFVLWKFRSLKDKTEDIQKIREFTDESLENAKRLVMKEEDKLAEEVYGVDTQKMKSKIGASKIYLAVLIDLLNDFRKGTIRVSEDELIRKDISLWISFGSLLSAIIFISAVFVTWVAWQSKTIIDFSSLSSDQTLINAAKFAIMGPLFAFAVLLFAASASLLWDIGFKRIGNTQLIRNNLKARLKKHVWLEVVIPLILGFFKIFF